MIGLPGVGKSTVIKSLLKDYPKMKVVSTDEFIEDYALKHKIDYSQAFKIMGDKAMGMMNAKIQNLIKSGSEFIWDQTNVAISSRNKKLGILNKNKYDVIVIAIELSEEEHQKRINQRKDETGKFISPKIVQQMKDSYTRPSSDELVSQIILIGDDGEYKIIFDKNDNQQKDNNLKSNF